MAEVQDTNLDKSMLYVQYLVRIDWIDAKAEKQKY